MIALVVAVGNRGEIGLRGDLPWPRNPEDLKRFRRLTWGQTVLMGRRTFESIGKPLPGRSNIVITRTMIPGTRCAPNLSTGIDGAETNVFVIGGARLYQEALPLCSEAHVTRVLGDFEADTFFDAVEIFHAWDLVRETPGPGIMTQHYRRPR